MIEIGDILAARRIKRCDGVSNLVLGKCSEIIPGFIRIDTNEDIPDIRGTFKLSTDQYTFDIVFKKDEIKESE